MFGTSTTKGPLPGANYAEAISFAADEAKREAIVKAFQVRTDVFRDDCTPV